MKKILIVVKPDLNGVAYHRQLIPHYYLNEQKGWSVAQINAIDTATDDFLLQFSAVQFCGLVSLAGNHQMVLQRLRSLGIRSIVDIDDYWVLPTSHPMYSIFKKYRITQQLIECITHADLITTTTGFLAALIQAINPRVEVIHNAINPAQPQFETDCQPCEKLRFGWVGSTTHLPDIKLLSHSMQQLHTSPFTSGRYQLFLMGFNPNDESGIYQQMEKIITTGLHINADVYYRINGANVFTYAQGYNLFDVSLIPLCHSLFNSSKSELKLIEAGFMRKAVIVSDVMPYSPLLTPENSIAIDPGRNYSDWYHAMHSLIKSPALATDLADGLYETVKEKYHIATANEIRVGVYEHLII